MRLIEVSGLEAALGAKRGGATRGGGKGGEAVENGGFRTRWGSAVGGGELGGRDVSGGVEEGGVGEEGGDVGFVRIRVGGFFDLGVAAVTRHGCGGGFLGVFGGVAVRRWGGLG